MICQDKKMPGLDLVKFTTKLKIGMSSLSPTRFATNVAPQGEPTTIVYEQLQNQIIQ